MKDQNAAARTLEITNTTQGKLPGLSFADIGNIKNAILGNTYELSLVIVGSAKSRNLNKTYRNKDKETNVLSFPLSKTEGEIFLNLSLAKKEAPLFDKTYTNFVTYLLIHGMLHLKGHEHGSTMERLEKKFLKKFG